MAFSVRELVIWAVPLGIAGFAAALGLRTLRDPSWKELPPQQGLPPPCPEGIFRCRDREVQMSTGDYGADGKACLFRHVASCRRACSALHVNLAGIDVETATKQLCDPPRRLDTLVSEERSFLAASASDAEVCEGDGYIPTSAGFDQCVLRSGKDPAASGVVTGRVKCRFGAVPTTERAPRLIKREEAIAAWCKRDPLWSPDAEVEDEASDAATDGASDARNDTSDTGDAYEAPRDASTG